MLNIYEQVDRNKRKSALIMGGFIIFIVLASWILAKALGYGASVAGWALVISGFMSLASYYWSDKLILRLSSAKPARREQDFDFYTVTENLCIAAQIPRPRLYIIEDSALNAFATGRDPDHAVVVATRGLLEKLDRTELEGVVAHELSHIRNYDIRVMALTTVLVGVVTLLADWFLRASYWGRGERRGRSGQVAVIVMLIGFLLALLSPIVANLIKLAVSRRREFLADASGVLLTKFPDGLARALEKISEDTNPLESANKATAHLYIANPLRNLQKGNTGSKGAVNWFSGLFMTHPPIQQRIAALKAMK